METTIDIKIKLDDNTEIKISWEDGLILYNQLKKLYENNKKDLQLNVDPTTKTIYGPIHWPITYTTLTGAK